jgi:hypothetical protein
MTPSAPGIPAKTGDAVSDAAHTAAAQVVFAMETNSRFMGSPEIEVRRATTAAVVCSCFGSVAECGLHKSGRKSRGEPDIP